MILGSSFTEHAPGNTKPLQAKRIERGRPTESLREKPHISQQPMLFSLWAAMLLADRVCEPMPESQTNRVEDKVARSV